MCAVQISDFRSQLHPVVLPHLSHFMQAPLLLLPYRYPARPDVDLRALGFLAVLIELIGEHRDHDDERADDQEEHVAVDRP